MAKTRLLSTIEYLTAMKASCLGGLKKRVPNRDLFGKFNWNLQSLRTDTGLCELDNLILLG
jgi:hypothetical protein